MSGGHPSPVALAAAGLRLGYDGEDVVADLDLAVPAGRTTAIVGANGCGKSTLLKALARLLQPRAGRVALGVRPIDEVPTKEVARELAILPQSPVAPEGLCVEDLVARGRYPHQRLFRHWSHADELALERALDLTDLLALRERPVEELSGGQRQRAWIAMTLAQETGILLLDEPTTFLDLAHQVEILDLLSALAADGRTVVMVLHDLDQACRYADQLIAMRGGQVDCAGRPGDVVEQGMVQRVFGLETRVIADPVTGTPICLPVPAAHRNGAALNGAGPPRGQLTQDRGGMT